MSNFIILPTGEAISSKVLEYDDTTIELVFKGRVSHSWSGEYPTEEDPFGSIVVEKKTVLTPVIVLKYPDNSSQRKSPQFINKYVPVTTPDASFTIKKTMPVEDIVASKNNISKLLSIWRKVIELEQSLSVPAKLEKPNVEESTFEDEDELNAEFSVSVQTEIDEDDFNPTPLEAIDSVKTDILKNTDKINTYFEKYNQSRPYIIDVYEEVDGDGVNRGAMDPLEGHISVEKIVELFGEDAPGFNYVKKIISDFLKSIA